MTAIMAATRPTRRDTLRHPFRSLAAILLVAVPVALLCIAFIITESGSSSTYLRVARTTATYQGGVCTQDLSASEVECTGSTTRPESELALLRENLPEGFSAQLTLSGTAELRHGDQVTSIYAIQSPQATGVSLPDSVMGDLGVGVGDTITLSSGDEVIIESRAPAGASVFPEPLLVDPASYSSLDQDPMLGGSWAITGPRAFTAADLAALNAAGFSAFSLDLREQPEYSFDWPMEIFYLIMGVVPSLIVAVLALLLISPVFTISVSRQTRTIAMLAAQGATPGHIRLAVLVYGVFAGLTGAVLGGLVGVLGASAWWLANYPGWPLQIPWPWILTVLGLAVIGATVSSFLPAVMAGRSSIISGIQGGAVDKMMHWRNWMLIGPVVLLLAGVALFILNRSAPEFHPATEAAELLCILAAVLAVPASAPALVWVVGALRGPLVLRLAARDLRRQSMRSVPAIAALAALIMIYSAVQTNDDARMAAERSAIGSVYPAGTMLLSVPAGTAADLRTSDITDLAGPVQRIDVYGYRPEDAWAEFSDSDFRWEEQHNYHYVPGPATDFGGGVALASPELLAMLGVPAPVPEGTATTYTSVVAEPGTRTFELREYHYSAQDDPPVRSITVPTTAVLPALFPEVLLSPEAFRELEVPERFLGAVLIPAAPPSPETMTALREQVNDGSRYLNLVSYEWGSPWYTDYILAAIVLTVMALVLALSTQQVRRQRIILESVGAAPATARAANAAFGALCAFTAAAFGLLTGYLGALVWATTTEVLNGQVIRYGTLSHTVPDWGQAGLLLLVVPLLCAVLGWVLTPKVELSEYRT